MDNLIEKFHEINSNLNLTNLDLLDEIYHQHLFFKDPSREINGLPAYVEYCRKVLKEASWRLDLKDKMVDSDKAILVWTCHLKHTRLQNGKEFSIDGLTQIRFDHKVYYQRDHFDLGGAVYERIPVIGKFLQLVKRKLL